MADNYLEKKYEEVFGSGAGSRTVANRPSLETLLRRTRSYRGYDTTYVVHRRQLEAIVRVNTMVPSGMNQQRLRFRLITKGEQSSAILGLVKMGAALPELHLPFPGTEPEAFIVVCCEGEENPTLDIDLGISLQSMMLKATELGLGGLIIRAFDKTGIAKALNLPLSPVAVMAVGKPAEKIELVEIGAGENHAYYRKEGVHYVPKVKADDLII